MNGRWKKYWLSLSLERKLRAISVCGGSAILCFVLITIALAGYGLQGFSRILQTNSRSMEFWAAVEEEGKAFQACMESENYEVTERYEQACTRSREALEKLPYDYERIGAERYGKTWSIRNLYENYVPLRDQVIEMESREPGYGEKLETVYRLQTYLKTYAGRLEQMTVEAGVETYHRNHRFVFLVPGLGMFLGGVVMVLFGRIRHFLNRNIVQPVLSLSQEARRIGANDFTGTIDSIQGEDEIAELVREFAGMKQATERYIVTLQEKHMVEKQLDEVRLQMLKNQIHPHFLFNTLNVIAGMAQIEDAETTEKMITALSRLFRYNLKATDSVMPLQQELKVVNDYLYLQKMRFGSRLRFGMDCPEETISVLVPSFALQPLVENAVIHGISHKGAGGLIHIRSWLDETRLWISVADTGLGMSEEQLAGIRKELERGKSETDGKTEMDGKTEKTERTGIGLGNICRRIQAMYPDGIFRIYSREGRGTVVQIGLLVTQDKEPAGDRHRDADRDKNGDIDRNGDRDGDGRETVSGASGR